MQISRFFFHNLFHIRSPNIFAVPTLRELYVKPWLYPFSCPSHHSTSPTAPSTTPSLLRLPIMLPLRWVRRESSRDPWQHQTLKGHETCIPAAVWDALTVKTSCLLPVPERHSLTDGETSLSHPSRNNALCQTWVSSQRMVPPYFNGTHASVD